LLAADRCAVPLLQSITIDGQRAPCDLQPGVTVRREMVPDFFAPFDHARVDRDVLPDGQRALPAVARAHQAELSAAGLERESLLLVAGRNPGSLREDPDLEKVHRLRLRTVELGVLDAGSGAHPLDVSRPDDTRVPHAVPVRQGALEDVGNDLHVAVAVLAE